MKLTFYSDEGCHQYIRNINFSHFARKSYSIFDKKNLIYFFIENEGHSLPHNFHFFHKNVFMYCIMFLIMWGVTDLLKYMYLTKDTFIYHW